MSTSVLPSLIPASPPLPANYVVQADIDAAIDRAGRESLIANGYAHTTISGVARAAKVSRPTVYARYRNVAEMAANILTQELVPLAASLSPAPTDVEQLVKHLVKATRKLLKNELITAIIAHDPQLLQTYQFVRLGRVQTHFISILTQILEQIAFSGAPLRQEKPEVMAAIIVTTLQSAAVQRGILQQIITSDELWAKQLSILLKEYLLP